MIKNKLNGTTEENIKQEFKNMALVGFVKNKDYSFLKKSVHIKGINEDAKIPREDVSGREITSHKQDRDYVKTLNDFDSKLPKINQ